MRIDYSLGVISCASLWGLNLTFSWIICMVAFTMVAASHSNVMTTSKSCHFGRLVAAMHPLVLNSFGKNGLTSLLTSPPSGENGFRNKTKDSDESN